MTPDEIQKDRAAGTPLTVEILADALSCFWNAALGAAHNQQAGFDAASIMAEGVGAIANRLAEYSKEHLTLTAENAALKERVADDYFGSLVTSARDAAEKATVKFPQPNYVTLKIAEEAGEVVRGAVHYAEGRMEWSEVEGEIVQLLAMLIRFVTEGDQTNGITPPRSIGEKP